MPLSPMGLWIIASLGYACALTCAIYLLRPRLQDASELTISTTKEGNE